MDHLFAYGTLMCDEIMRAVSGRGRLPSTMARIHGYRRRAVKEEQYPALVPDAGGCVDGVLYRGLTDAAWRRLDRFEGPMYERREVQVDLPDRTTAAAGTYVIRPEFTGRIADAEWDFEAFLRSGRAKFESRYVGFDSFRQ